MGNVPLELFLSSIVIVAINAIAVSTSLCYCTNRVVENCFHKTIFTFHIFKIIFIHLVGWHNKCTVKFTCA